MVRVREDGGNDRFNIYVGTLFEEVIKKKENLTSDQIVSYVRDKIVNDIGNRVNAILAIGSEVGSVSQNDSGRYLVSEAIVLMDAALDKCCQPQPPCPRRRFRCCLPLTCCPVPVCCAPCCCYRRLNAFSRRKKRELPANIEDEEKFCQQMSDIGELNS